MFVLTTSVDLSHVGRFPPADLLAASGKWVTTKGETLFTALGDIIKDFPIWAEDLGEITPEVTALRDKFHFMGLKILKFGFEGSGEGIWSLNGFLSRNYTDYCIVYTGAHDNNTVRDWFADLDEDKRQKALDYANTSEIPFGWDFVRLAFSSVADFAIIPMQDYLNLGSEARMNTPSTVGEN